MNNKIKNLGIKGKVLIFILTILIIFLFMFFISYNASKSNLKTIEYTEQASAIIKRLYEIDNYINQYKITSDINLIKKTDDTFQGLKQEADILLVGMPYSKNKELLKTIKNKIDLTEKKYRYFLIKYEEKKKYDIKKITLDKQKIELEKIHKELNEKISQLQKERIIIEKENEIIEKQYEKIKNQFDELSNFIINKIDNVIIKNIQQREMKSILRGIEIKEEEKNLKNIAYSIIGQYTFLLKDIEAYIADKKDINLLHDKITTLKEHIDQLDLYYISTNNSDEAARKVFDSITIKLNKQIAFIEELKIIKNKYEANNKEYNQNLKKYEENTKLSIQSIENYNKNKVAYEKNISAYQNNQNEYEGVLSELRNIIDEITGISGEFYKNIKTDSKKSKSNSDFSIIFLFSFITIICSIGFLLFKNYIANQETVNRRRLTSILNNMNDCLITINANCQIESCNHTTEKVLGYKESELYNKSICRLFQGNCKNQNFMNNECKLFQFISNKTDVAINKKNGDYFYADIGVNSIEFGDKKLYILTIHDITHYIEIEKMKNEFVSTVSHELRTPITSIKGSLELMLNKKITKLPEAARKLAEISYNNSIRLVDLINDILDIEKIASGKMEFKIEQFELMPLVETTIENTIAYAKNYDVNLKLVNSIPSVMVYSDKSRLCQVLTNLISNASKFSKKGDNVDISVSKLDEKYIRISVKDYGFGIPESFKSKVFQKFVQADSSTTRKKGGTGLGLAICKAIIENLKGQISFESKEGEGSTFYVDVLIHSA